MAIRDRALLKSWFKRGAYPTAAQFADWIDSFWHKEEDKMPISSVEGLPEHINGKYGAAEGEQLKTNLMQLKDACEAHKQASRRQFASIADDIKELEAEDAVLQTSLTNAHDDIGKIREVLGGGATLDETKAALVALGPNYEDLRAVANTLKTFLQSNDTADSTINTWREIESFLQGITDTENLTALLADLRKECDALVGIEKSRAEAAEKDLVSAIAGKAEADDPRLSDAREAAGGFADSISNRRDASEHYGIWVGTQEEYDAIETKDATTIYYTL